MTSLFRKNHIHPELIRLEKQLESLKSNVTETGLIGFRNRVFIDLVAASGLAQQSVCRLKLWQLTFWHQDSVKPSPYPCRNAIPCGAPSNIPLGLYLNRNFQKIIPLHLKNRHSIRRYVVTLIKHGVESKDFLFPAIDKGDHIKKLKCIDSSYANKFLRAAKEKSVETAQVSWPEIKRLIIASMLEQGMSWQYICSNTDYQSRSGISKVAKHFGFTFHSEKSFQADFNIGYDYIGSFLTFNFPWYLSRIDYESEYQMIAALHDYKIWHSNKTNSP